MAYPATFYFYRTVTETLRLQLPVCMKLLGGKRTAHYFRKFQQYARH